jgi:hypothetical protein
LTGKTFFIIFGVAFYCPKAIFPFFSWLPRFFGGAFFISKFFTTAYCLLPTLQSDSSLSRHTMPGLYGRFPDLTFFIFSHLRCNDNQPAIYLYLRVQYT